MRVTRIIRSKKDIVYDINHVEGNGTYIANNFIVHNCDESVKFAQSAEWAKREHKQLKMKLAQVRTKHLLYILCFPLKVEKLEKNYLDSFTNYWIDIFGRGIGVVYVKDRNPMMDSWRMQEFKHIGSYTEFTKIDQIEEKIKKHPNFWQVLRFPKPPEWLYTQYLKMREKNVYGDEVVWQSTTKEDIHAACLLLALQDFIQNDPSLSISKIMTYIKSEYDMSVSKNVIQERFDDARQLVMKARENVIKGEHIEKHEDAEEATV